ncbi:MAG: ribosome maturation factor RimP [Cyclobacteriaceae bacterium]|nr:MAG: ribosome maturation factor RimP [Cyclobacteriaceae bacterium]
MNLEEKLAEMVVRHLPDSKYFLTEINAKPAGSKTKISIFLDGDDGIDIDTCAAVSRQLGKELEDLNVMDHPYTLMVSSPGLDRPLKLPRQYHRNIGRALKIKLNNQQLVEGKLSEVQEGFIVLEEIPAQQGEIKKDKIPFAEIETTHVLVSF